MVQECAIISVKVKAKEGRRTMGRSEKVFEKKRVNVWVLANQEADIRRVRELTGKSQTDVVVEALAIYFSLLRKQGVL